MDDRDKLFEKGNAWDENQDEITEPYLFSVGIPGQHPYEEVDWEILAVNDFCYLMTETVKLKIEKLKDDLSAYKSGTKKLILEDDPLTGVGRFDKAGNPIYGPNDYTEEAIEGIEKYTLPFWEDKAKFLAKTVSLVMVAFFTEKRLFDIAFDCAGRKPKWKPEMGKIESYLSFLRAECNINFEEPKEAKVLRKKSIDIRNGFAHGEWDKVKTMLDGIYIRDSFKAVSDLLKQLPTYNPPEI